MCLGVDAFCHLELCSHSSTLTDWIWAFPPHNNNPNNPSLHNPAVLPLSSVQQLIRLHSLKWKVSDWTGPIIHSQHRFSSPSQGTHTIFKEAFLNYLHDLFVMCCNVSEMHRGTIVLSRNNWGFDERRGARRCFRTSSQRMKHKLWNQISKRWKNSFTVLFQTAAMLDTVNLSFVLITSSWFPSGRNCRQGCRFPQDFLAKWSNSCSDRSVN